MEVSLWLLLEFLLGGAATTERRERLELLSENWITHIASPPQA